MGAVMRCYTHAMDDLIVTDVHLTQHDNESSLTN